MPISPELKQQLDQMSDKDVMDFFAAVDQVNAEAKAQQSPQPQRIIGGRAGRIIGGALEGALLTSQGRPLSEGVITGAKPEGPDKYEELLRMEALKNQTDPSRITAQMELDELKRRKAEQDAGVQSQPGQAQAITPTVPGATPQTLQETQPASGTEAPPMFINKPKGKDKYGIMEYDTVDNPEYKQWQDMKKEERSIDLQAKKAAEKDRQLNVSKISRLTNIVDIIEKEYGKTKTPGGASGFVRRPIETFGRRLQITDNQRQDKAYADFANGMRVQLARAMSEVGNLSEPEQKAALALIPNLLDDPRTAQIKLQQLRDLVTTVKENAGNSGVSEEIPSVGSSFNGEKVLKVRKIQ